MFKNHKGINLIISIILKIVCHPSTSISSNNDKSSIAMIIISNKSWKRWTIALTSIASIPSIMNLIKNLSIRIYLNINRQKKSQKDYNQQSQEKIVTHLSLITPEISHKFPSLEDKIMALSNLIALQPTKIKYISRPTIKGITNYKIYSTLQRPIILITFIGFLISKMHIELKISSEIRNSSNTTEMS